jgi:hypothetical protein
MIFISPSQDEENHGGSWFSSHLRGWADSHGGPWFSSHQASQDEENHGGSWFSSHLSDGVIIMVGHDFQLTKQDAWIRKIMVGHDFPLIWEDGVTIMVGHDFHLTKPGWGKSWWVMIFLSFEWWGDSHGGPWFSSHQASRDEENHGGSWFSSHLRGWGDNHGGPWFPSHQRVCSESVSDLASVFARFWQVRV